LAILLTAFLFGVSHYPFIHANFYQAASMGAVFGWSYSKTKNLWVPIAIHGFHNIILYSVFIPN
jgi:membrane protease YdiL (CAAX protease family)